MMQILTTSNGYRLALDPAQPGILLRQRDIGEWTSFRHIDGEYASPQDLMAYLATEHGEIFAGQRAVAWEGGW